MTSRQAFPSMSEETHHAPATLAPLSSLADPIPRVWDATGCTNRTILLHAFNVPCGLATMAWDELHYTTQVVLRMYMQRFLKRGQVPA